MVAFVWRFVFRCWSNYTTERIVVPWLRLADYSKCSAQPNWAKCLNSAPFLVDNCRDSGAAAALWSVSPISKRREDSVESIIWSQNWFWLFPITNKSPGSCNKWLSFMCKFRSNGICSNSNGIVVSAFVDRSIAYNFYNVQVEWDYGHVSMLASLFYL